MAVRVRVVPCRPFSVFHPVEVGKVGSFFRFMAPLSSRACACARGHAPFVLSFHPRGRSGSAGRSFFHFSALSLSSRKMRAARTRPAHAARTPANAHAPLVGVSPRRAPPLPPFGPNPPHQGQRRCTARASASWSKMGTPRGGRNGQCVPPSLPGSGRARGSCVENTVVQGLSRRTLPAIS